MNNVEFDKTGKPHINRFDEIASRLLPYVIKVVFYVLLLALGLYHTDVIEQSHFLRLAAYFIGFIVASFLWLIACIIPCFVFGVEYIYAKQVFNIFSNADFRISVTLVILLIPLSKFIVNTIIRMTTSYLYRKYIFLIAVLINVISLVAIIAYISSKQNFEIYVFSYISLGLIYSILMMRKSTTSDTWQKQNIYDKYFSGKNDEINNNENFQRI